MSAEIDISFIVPVYGSEKYLDRCLESIVSQKNIRYEILIVNDYSPGNCDEVVANFANQFPAISLRYLKHEKNRSLMQARLTGIFEAQGKYLIHLDSDDWLSSEVGQKAVEIANKRSADIVHFSMVMAYDDGRRIPHFSNWSGMLKGSEIFENLVVGKIWWTQCGKLFRRNIVVEALKEFAIDRSLHINSLEDFVLTLPMTYRARVYIANEKLGTYFYYVNQNSMTKRLTSYEAKWEKLCHDMGEARRLMLEFSRKIESSYEDRLEERFYINYVWAFGLIKDLAVEKRSKYFSRLISIFNEKKIIEKFDNSHFDILSEALISIKQAFARPEKVKHIAFFSESLRNGGAERASSILANLLLRKGFQVSVITTEAATSGDYELNPGVVRHVIEGTKGERWLATKALVKSNAIDLCVHTSHFDDTMMYDILSLVDTGVFQVAVEHSMFFFPLYQERPDLFKIKNAAYKAVDSLICLSDFNKKWWIAAGVKTATVIPNPLTFERPKELDVTFKSGKNVIFVGRVCEAKGAFRALDVIAHLVEKHPDIKLMVLGRYGSDLDEENFQRKIRSLGIEKNIEVLGHQSAIGHYFDKANVHIMTSRIEGAPMVLMEAKAYGVPTVSFEMSYLAYSGEDNGCVMVGKDDVDGMANIIDQLLSSSEYWMKLSLRARESIKHISNEKVVDEWHSLVRNFEQGKVDDHMIPDPTLVLTMKEVIGGIDYYYNEFVSIEARHRLPPYLAVVNTLITKILPLNSYRRKQAVVFYKYLRGLYRKF